MKSTEQVLGVMVTGRAVHAVLVQGGSDGPVIQRSFVRQRTRGLMMAQAGMVGAMAGEPMEDASGNDFTLHFGDGNASANDLFLSSEFGGAEPQHADERNGTAGAPINANFMIELSEILEHCREMGVERPRVVFVSGSADISSYELEIEEKPGKKAKALQPEQLTQALAASYQGEYEKDRVGFIPMTSSEKGRRYLSVLSKPTEPVALTLKAMRERKNERLPNVRALDCEVSGYMGMSRTANRLDEAAGRGTVAATERHTLIVRAGAEDTLVLFMQGDVLQHYDCMRSLTSFDSPETICSRVLLLQDEYGFEDIHSVMLLSEEREEELIDSFCMFFPDAEVRSIRMYLPPIEAEEDVMAGSWTMVPTTAAALHLINQPPYEKLFDEINLLPKKLIRRPLTLPLTWPNLAMAVLLFVTAFFFAARFVVMQNEINDYKDRLGTQVLSQTDSDPKVLQARIDSMQAAYTGYMTSLDVLDTLLVGSDRWTRTLESITRNTGAVKGIWIETMEPVEGDVRMTGAALSRERAVALASRLNAEVEALAFSEIREWPVYTFTFRMKVPDELPQAARYLREQNGGSGAPTAKP